MRNECGAQTTIGQRRHFNEATRDGNRSRASYAGHHRHPHSRPVRRAIANEQLAFGFGIGIGGGGVLVWIEEC